MELSEWVVRHLLLVAVDDLGGAKDSVVRAAVEQPGNAERTTCVDHVSRTIYVHLPHALHVEHLAAGHAVAREVKDGVDAVQRRGHTRRRSEVTLDERESSLSDLMTAESFARGCEGNGCWSADVEQTNFLDRESGVVQKTRGQTTTDETGAARDRDHTHDGGAEEGRKEGGVEDDQRICCNARL